MKFRPFDRAAKTAAIMSSSLAGDDDDSAAVRAPTKQADSSLARICSHCGRRFGCGKALGGHMRIHRSKKPKPAAAAAADLSSGEEISCKICGKKFESWRSVFGHMRAHPDCEWRGVHSPPPQPPPCAAADPVSSGNSLSSTVSDSHNHMHDSGATVAGPNSAADLTESLSFWPVTGRRGRKGKRNAVSVSDGAVTERRSRLFKKKMRKLSDLETDRRQGIDGWKQKSGCVSNIHRRRRRRRGGGSWKCPESESAATYCSVASNAKNDVIIYKNSDNKELDRSAEHNGGWKLLQIDLNELPIMEEEDEDGGTESTQ